MASFWGLHFMRGQLGQSQPPARSYPISEEKLSIGSESAGVKLFKSNGNLLSLSVFEFYQN